MPVAVISAKPLSGPAPLTVSFDGSQSQTFSGSRQYEWHLADGTVEDREQFERTYLQQQLVLCGGKVGQLAKRVGMERTHLYRKLRSLGVDFKSVASDD